MDYATLSENIVSIFNEARSNSISEDMPILRHFTEVTATVICPEMEISGDDFLCAYSAIVAAICDQDKGDYSPASELICTDSRITGHITNVLMDPVATDNVKVNLIKYFLLIQNQVRGWGLTDE